MTKLKVATVGCGFIAQKWQLPAFLKLKRSINLSAVCDSIPNFVNQAAKELGIKNEYGNIQDILKKEIWTLLTHAPQ
jgi:predicted dehydrogenase